MRITTVIAAAFIAAAPTAAFATADTAPQPAAQPKMTLLAQSATGQQKRYEACIRRELRRCARQTSSHGRRYCIYRARAICSRR